MICRAVADASVQAFPEQSYPSAFLTLCLSSVPIERVGETRSHGKCERRFIARLSPSNPAISCPARRFRFPLKPGRSPANVAQGTD